jgi:hypothetical protein
MATYTHRYNGRGIVADFRRLLKTGDMGKLTPRLYHALTMHGGFIAHFDINGFRATYAGKLSELLRGEFRALTDPDHFNWPALEDSVYADGLTAGEIMREIAKVGAEMVETVREREATARRLAEISALTERYGIGQGVASAMVNGRGVEVTLRSGR